MNYYDLKEIIERKGETYFQYWQDFGQRVKIHFLQPEELKLDYAVHLGKSILPVKTTFLIISLYEIKLTLE